MTDTRERSDGTERRTIVISDVHGCLEELVMLLDKVSYRAGVDNLLLLGDYVNKGPDSRGVVELVMRLAAEKRVTVLKGNHDQRFADLFAGRAEQLEEPFLEQGGGETLRSYLRESRGRNFERKRFAEALKHIRERYAVHAAFLKDARLYAEDDRHIYVHAGLDPKYPDWKKQPETNFYTIRGPFLTNPTVVDKIVVFGHTPAPKLHGKPDIWFQPDKIGIDGGCSAGGQLNALVLEPGVPLRTFAVSARGR